MLLKWIATLALGIAVQEQLGTGFDCIETSSRDDVRAKSSSAKKIIARKKLLDMPLIYVTIALEDCR